MYRHRESEPLSTLCQRAPPEAWRLQPVIASLSAKGEESGLSKNDDERQDQNNNQWIAWSLVRIKQRYLFLASITQLHPRPTLHHVKGIKVPGRVRDTFTLMALS